MNTVTIAVLVLCATLAFVSATPGDEKPVPGQAPEAELLEGAEARWHGGGDRYHGGGDRYHGGGDRYHGGGDRYHGGGDRYHGGGGRYHGRHW